MGKTGETLEPRIYVVCLAAYNNGRLHGTWIEVGDDAKAVWGRIEAMLKASPVALAEEHAIHDYEGFGGIEIAEYAAIDRVVEIAGFLRERGTLGALVLQHLDGEIDAAVEALDHNYRGVFERPADCFQELTEETVEIPESLRLYIDYDAMAKDAELNGDIFTIGTAYNEVHVFWAR